MQTRYRIYINQEIQGPYDLDELMKLEKLSKESLVCEVGDAEWESIGSCRSIQQQLAKQPLKWGAVQKIVLNVSAILPQNQKSGWNVSASGDFQERERQRSLEKERRILMARPVQKKGIFSRFFNLLHGKS